LTTLHLGSQGLLSQGMNKGKGIIIIIINNIIRIIFVVVIQFDSTILE